MAAPELMRVGRRERPPLGTLLAIAVAPVALVVAIALTDPGGVLLTLSFGIPGLILVIRRPGQPIAWMLLLMALGLLLGTMRVSAPIGALLAGTVTGLDAFTAWANGTGWAFVFAGFTGLALVFPSGRLPAGRSRVASLVLIAAYVPVAGYLLFGPIINVTVPGGSVGIDVPNPYALRFLASSLEPQTNTGHGWGALLVFTVVATAMLLSRFRRSQGLERLQYRWLAWAVLIVVVANCIWAVVTGVLQVGFAPLAAVIVGVSYPAIPIAVVVAILRYRLYDIDRLVSRTMGWGIATMTVGAVFVAVVLALQAVLVGVTQNGTLAVAASTLLAVALFQPVRRRVQTLVDRRFDRPRLEAERILAGHGERLRHETNLERIEFGVLDTVSETLRPSSASMWIRHADAQAQ